MVEGYGERYKDDLKRKELLACWIINGTGWVKSAVKPGDLLKFREAPELSSGEAKEFMDESASFAKSKFWALVDDKYAKKTE